MVELVCRQLMGWACEGSVWSTLGCGEVYWLNCGFMGMYGSEAGVVVVELCLLVCWKGVGLYGGWNQAECVEGGRSCYSYKVAVCAGELWSRQAVFRWGGSSIWVLRSLYGR